MKTFLLTCALSCALTIAANAQPTSACNLVSVSTQFVSSSASLKFPGKCDVKVNLSWEQEANNGNKYSYVHIWPTSAYESFAYSNPSRPPMANDLLKTMGTIIVKNPSSANPSLYVNYNPDDNYKKIFPLAGYASLAVKKTTVGNIDRFTVENLVLAGIDCNANGVYSFTADAWSSQKDDGENVHCVSSNNRFATNEMVDRSASACATNAVNVQLLSLTAGVNGTVKVYADLTSLGKFEPSIDALLSTETFSTSAAAQVGGTWGYRYTTSVSVPATYRRNNFWIEIKGNGGVASQVFFVTNTCAPLPENLASFTATRVRNNVQLKWQTVNEQASKGFDVLRKTTGGWEKVAFVPTRSGGNSSDKVSYDYNETNNFSGISQYQVAEVTTQGRPKYSEIRAVKGEGQSGKIMLFPNPSNNGRASLVFDNATARDITLLDAAGRTVKEYRAITNTNISFENLEAGLYAVRIRVQSTNEIFTEKLLVSKR